MPLNINIDFSNFETLTDDEKALRLKLLHSILSKKLPPKLKTYPVRLKPSTHSVKFNGKKYKFTVKQPIFLVEENGEFYYAVKARKDEPNAIIGEPGGFGKAMEIYAFLHLNKTNNTLVYTPNDSSLLVKVNALKSASNEEEWFTEIRSEASYNALVYGDTTKKPIFSIGSHVNNIVVKAYQIMRRLPKISGDVLLENWVTKSPPLKERLTVALAVILAVCQQHRRGIMHRDIKPSNVLFDPASSKAYLTDQGLALHKDAPTELRKIAVGSPAFTNPVILLSAHRIPAEQSSDIYPLMVTLIMILSPGCTMRNNYITKDFFAQLWNKPLMYQLMFEIQTAQDKSALCRNYYPKVSFAGIDQLKELSDTDKKQLKEYFIFCMFDENKPTAEAIFDKISSIAQKYGVSIPGFSEVSEIPEVIEIPEVPELPGIPDLPIDNSPKMVVKESSSFATKLKAIAGFIACLVIGTVGAGLIFTGIFSWLGMGLVGLSVLGFSGLLGWGIYACCKGAPKPEVLEPEVPHIEKIDLVPNCIYRPILNNSYQFIQKYPELESMVGYKEVTENFYRHSKEIFTQQEKLAKHDSNVPAGCYVGSQEYLPPSNHY